MTVRDLATSMASSDINKVVTEDSRNNILDESLNTWSWCSAGYKKYADCKVYSWRVENKEFHIVLMNENMTRTF